MSPEHRPIAMRANRLLGASLVEHNLVQIQHLESANDRLLELMNSDQARQTSLLGILAYEQKVVREEQVLEYLVDAEGLGLVDLRHYEIADEFRKNLDLGTCWATWSIPFDREEDFVFVATAYYLSPAVRNYWAKQLEAPIIWFGTTLDVIADTLEKMEAERSAAAN